VPDHRRNRERFRKGANGRQCPVRRRIVKMTVAIQPSEIP
jgi:hypothetical protein